MNPTERPGTASAGHQRAPGGAYRVGDLILDTARERVTRGGVEIDLAKLSFELLATLVRSAPDLVSVDALMSRVWPGLVVGPETVSQRVKLVRTALDDDSKEPRYIEGVRGRGYRIVAPVTQLDPNGTVDAAGQASGHGTTAGVEVAARARKRRALWIGGGAAAAVLLATAAVLRWAAPVGDIAGSPESPAAANAPAEASVAVLPFVNLSSDPEQEYFADGLTEELISTLASIEGLRVPARTSSFYFKGRNEDMRTIAAALGVEHVLESSVRKSGDDLRITTQLIDSRTGLHVWANTYERKLDDILAIQDDIATKVADALQITLGVGELARMPGMTRNAAAYEEYLLAREGFDENGTADGLRRSAGHLERAVALDPSFADAWLDLYSLSTIAPLFITPEEAAAWAARGELALARARELTPDSPRLLQMLASISVLERGDWLEQNRLLEEARSAAAKYSLPQLVLADIALRDKAAGRVRAALPGLEAWRAADPLNPVIAWELSEAYTNSGNLEAALAEQERALSLEPSGWQVWLPVALFTAVVANDAERVERFAALFERRLFDVEGARVTAELARLSSNPDAARSALRRMQEAEPSDPTSLAKLTFAQFEAYVGEPERALELLREVSAEGVYRNGLVVRSLWRPILRDVRRLEGFKDLVRDFGLVDYWRATGDWGDFCRPLGDDDFECQ